MKDVVERVWLCIWPSIISDNTQINIYKNDMAHSLGFCLKKYVNVKNKSLFYFDDENNVI